MKPQRRAAAPLMVSRRGTGSIVDANKGRNHRAYGIVSPALSLRDYHKATTSPRQHATPYVPIRKPKNIASECI
jgi:hypothetical protein